MIFLIIILLALIIGFIYKRYFPILGVRCSHHPSNHPNAITVVDVRDYNQSYNDSIEDSVNIPVGYLKRYFHEIPNLNIHIIASNSLEKNMSIRFFRKRGFKVVSYTLTECNCN